MTAGTAAIHRVLHADAPGDMLAEAVLRRDAWLPRFLEDADAIPAGPRAYHSGSVLTHLARCMNAVAGDPLAVWMALAHDAGKLTTPASLWPHHYGHELRGESLAALWAHQLDLPDDYARAGSMAALLHMKAGRYATLRPGKKYDLLRTVTRSGFFVPFWNVVTADTRTNIGMVAEADWQRICSLALADMTPECARQHAIALLKGNTMSGAYKTQSTS